MRSCFSFLFSNPKSISNEKLERFVEGELLPENRLGLAKGNAIARWAALKAMVRAESMRSILDPAQSAFIVFDLARGTGNAPLADKILERLEASETWKDQKIDLGNLKRAVKEAEKTIEYGQKNVNPTAFQKLASELGLRGLSNEGALRYEGELTYQKAAEILADQIARKENEPRIAILLKRHVFDAAFIRKRELKDWDVKAIKDNIKVAKSEIAKEHARSNQTDLLSKKVQRHAKHILKYELDRWVEGGRAREDRSSARDRILYSAEQRSPQLDLTGLGLTSLPEVGSSLTHLKVLELSNNQLTSLPESVRSITQLQKLDMRGNLLQRFPDSIESLTQLQELNVSQNLLDRLPESIGSLSRLQRLNVSQNRLDRLPESIGSLVELQTLDVSQNRLDRLPESIGSLVELERLNVSQNQLQRLSESLGSLGSLGSLTYLNVSNNRLTSLPNSVSSQSRFYVHIEGNSLSRNVLSDWQGARAGGIYANMAASVAMPQEQALQSARQGARAGGGPGIYANMAASVAMPQEQVLLSAWQGVRAGGGPNIYANMAASVAMPQEQALDQIVADWYRGTGRENVSATVVTTWKALEGTPNANRFANWLARLQNTPDYQNAETQGLLKERVITILETLLNDQELRETCFGLAVEALEACDDRIALGLNNIEMAVLNNRAVQENWPQEELLRVGRGMFRLRQLDPIALEKIKSLNGVEGVEVLLAYQVGLREELQLPVQTHKMNFRAISGVSDQDLAVARERVKAAEGGGALLEFFVDWQPWREYLQREYSSQFKQLETVLEMRNEQLTDLLTAAQDGQIEGEKILLDKYNEVPEVGKKLARALQIKLTLACLTPNVTLSTKFDPVGLPAKPALEELQWRNAIGKQIIEMGLPVANQEPEAQLWETLASHWNRAVQLTKSSQDMEWCQNYLEEIKSSAGVDKARIAGMLEALKRSNQQPGDD